MESAGLLTLLQPLVPVSTCLLSTPKPQNSSSRSLGPCKVLAVKPPASAANPVFLAISSPIRQSHLGISWWGQVRLWEMGSHALPLCGLQAAYSPSRLVQTFGVRSNLWLLQPAASLFC